MRSSVTINRMCEYCGVSWERTVESLVRSAVGVGTEPSVEQRGYATTTQSREITEYGVRFAGSCDYGIQTMQYAKQKNMYMRESYLVPFSATFFDVLCNEQATLIS